VLAGNDRLFKQIKMMVESTGKAIAVRDAAAAMKFNSRFHNLVVESCGNPYLVIIMTNLEKLILFYRIALLKTSIGDPEHNDDYFEHLVRGNERQMQIADMMMQRNAKQAKLLMEQHLLASADDMARLLQTS
jgi:DNA-binding GntR family transcriptional regulator